MLLLGLAMGAYAGAAFGLGALLRSPLPAALLLAAACALLFRRLLGLDGTRILIQLLFIVGAMIGYGIAIAEPLRETPGPLHVLFRSS